MPPEETPDPMDEIVRSFLSAIGEDPSREGLRDTPSRVTRAWKGFTSGYAVDVDKLIRGAMFEERCNEMVVVRDIELYSMCEHHLLPFFGKCHVAYTPSDRIVGLSKVARVVDAFARRLQVQERLTNQIAKAIFEHLKPLGVGVIVEARHLCMMMRGVEKQNSLCITSSLLGDFQDDARTRNEFLKLIHSSCQ